MDCACPKPKVALALQVFFDVQGWSDRPVTLSGYTLPSHSLMARLANRKYIYCIYAKYGKADKQKAYAQYASDAGRADTL